MPSETARRRGHHEDSVYFDASKNRWVGATSLGFSTDGQQRIRQKARGRTKTEVRDKLQALHRDLEAGLRVSASPRPTRWRRASETGSMTDKIGCRHAQRKCGGLPRTRRRSIDASRFLPRRLRRQVGAPTSSTAP
jgi:hypothetical protein